VECACENGSINSGSVNSENSLTSSITISLSRRTLFRGVTGYWIRHKLLLYNCSRIYSLISDDNEEIDNSLRHIWVS